MTNPSRPLVSVVRDRADLSRLEPLVRQGWATGSLALGSRAAYPWCLSQAEPRHDGCTRLIPGERGLGQGGGAAAMGRFCQGWTPSEARQGGSANGGASRQSGERGYDAVIVGSGFGGTLAAHTLVLAGWRVLMLERGDWVARGEHNRDLTAHWNDRDGYSLETPYAVGGASRKRLGAFHCVGGPSVFYGGVSLRMREDDFRTHPHVSQDLRWPLEYANLEPHYERAEALLGVSGDPSEDPTTPPRRSPLPAIHQPLSPTSRTLRDAARRLGMRPFRLPLALNVDGSGARPLCTACGVCDGFACAIGAKNDLASAVLPDLLRRGLTLRPNTVVVGLDASDGRVRAAECVDRLTGERVRFEARHFVLAAGALATPHVLLASGLERNNPAGDCVGRYLMRHCNGIVIGASVPPAGASDEFRKQIGVHDFYFGDPAAPEPSGKLGAIQQVRATQIALLMARLPAAAKRAAIPTLERMVGFIVIAEDQPHPENRVYLDPTRRDRFGRAQARIHHRHTPRDLAARRRLGDRAAEILREAGSAFELRVPVGTFSHGLGTVRMGDDPARFPVAPNGRFRGTENLWITDASVFPTSAAVNPSLSISANALRIATRILLEDAPRTPRARPSYGRPLPRASSKTQWQRA